MQLIELATAMFLAGAGPIEAPRMCSPEYTPTAEVVDETLFWLYLRADKVDKFPIRTFVKNPKAKDKSKGHWVTVGWRDAPYGSKDSEAADRLGMGLKEYEVGGAKTEFKLRVYCHTAAAIAAGHQVVVTSLFRDDYRQRIAEGIKSADNASFHGGSKRGGYGNGVAVDLSVNGSWSEKEAFWKWSDAHREYGLVRVYGSGDPPHFVPSDGQEIRTASRHKHKKIKKVRVAKR